MRLESSLYSSQQGIMAHGQAISVLSDNISNVSTTGFKRSVVSFGDIVAEGYDGRQSTADAVAGNGVAVERVRPIHEGGTIEFTGRNLDLAIEGSGFFVSGTTTQQFFSRAGDFAINKEGELVNSAGQTVLGFPLGSTELGVLNLYNVQIDANPTTEVSLAGNLDSRTEVGVVPNNPTSFRQLSEGSSYLANIEAIDSLGASHDLVVSYTKTDANTWVAQLYIDGEDVGGEAGVPTQIGANLTLNFNSNGQIEGTPALTGNIPYVGGAAAGNLTIGLSGFGQLAGMSEVKSIVSNGEGTGSVKSFAVEADGSVVAQLNSGRTATVGTLALAEFRNVDGLERQGKALFAAGELAGDPEYRRPGESGSGSIAGGALELSTVDLGTELVNLVLYQKGFQANTKAFQAGEEMISQGMNLKR